MAYPDCVMLECIRSLRYGRKENNSIIWCTSDVPLSSLISNYFNLVKLIVDYCNAIFVIEITC